MAVSTENRSSLRPYLVWAAAAVAVVFGLLTVASGGRVLFGDDAARAAAGDVVPFVLWFNFGAGFFYVAAGFGVGLGRRWGEYLAAAIAIATVGVFAALCLYILADGPFEARTVAAMALRSVVWVAIAVISRHSAMKSIRA